MSKRKTAFVITGDVKSGNHFVGVEDVNVELIGKKNDFVAVMATVMQKHPEVKQLISKAITVANDNSITEN